MPPSLAFPPVVVRRISHLKACIKSSGLHHTDMITMLKSQRKSAPSMPLVSQDKVFAFIQHHCRVIIIGHIITPCLILPRVAPWIFATLLVLIVMNSLLYTHSCCLGFRRRWFCKERYFTDCARQTANPEDGKEAHCCRPWWGDTTRHRHLEINGPSRFGISSLASLKSVTLSSFDAPITSLQFLLEDQTGSHGAPLSFMMHAA